MSWLWPEFLLLLAIVPLMIAAYIWMLRRRRRFAVRYSSLSLVRAAMPRHSWLRRHLPFALFMLAVTSLVLTLSRPVSIVAVPTNQTSIILALDVSRSMLQTDIAPSRLDAAEAAALSFIEQQSSSTRIGIVAFAGFAEMIQPPTTDQEALEDAIASLTTGRGTAIGSGILKSLDVIAEVDPNVKPSDTDGSVVVEPVPEGAYAPEIIVVLTDGVATTGMPPVEAAQQASDRGVRVYTIGFGTENGSEIPGERNWGRDPFDRDPWAGGGRFRRGIDEATLQQVADMTGGKYYTAESAEQLQSVFESLPTSLITAHEVTEISVAFAAFGALLATLAIVLSMLWHPLP
ncbi:MAG TPA: VWA domain-containing protein [Herpetosiphonaceae bacterium]